MQNILLSQFHFIFKGKIFEKLTFKYLHFLFIQNEKYFIIINYIGKSGANSYTFFQSSYVFQYENNWLD